MASNLSLAVKLTLSSAEFRAALKSSNEEVRSFAQKIGTQLRSAETPLDQFTAKFGSLGGVIRASAGALAGLYSASRLADLARDAVQASIAFDRQQKALANVAGSAAGAARDFAFLRDVGDRMGTSVSDLATSWLSFGNAIKGSALEGEAGRGVFAGIVSTLADMNASSEQTAAVLFQVAQGISKEKVQLEDLNIIAERGIPIFRMLADALGITKAELFDQISKGLIPADEAYRKVFGTIDNGTRRIEGTTQSLSRLSTEWNEFLVNIGNSAPIQGAVDALGGLLKQLNDVSEATKSVAVPTLSADSVQLEQKRAGLEFQLKELTDSPFGANKVAIERINQQLREVERQQQLVRLLAAPKEQAAAEQSLFDRVTAEQLRARPSADGKRPEYDKTKAAVIADYLESRGLRPLQVAAVVGNLAQEAPGGAGNFGTALSGDKGSIGLAQWRLERKDELLKFAAEQGAPATDIKVQLDFLVAEARRRGDLDAVNAARSPSEAASIFMRRFERPDEAKSNLDYRAAVAEDVFAQSSIDRLRLASRSKSATHDESSTTSRIDEEQKLSEELTRIEEHRTEIIVKQRDELRQKGIEAYDLMVSDLQQAVDEERQIIAARADFEAQINAQADADFQRRQTAQKEFLRGAYDAKLISATDYFSKLQALADAELQHTQQRIDAEMALEAKRLQAISASIEVLAAKSQNVTDLQVQQIESAARLEGLAAQKRTAGQDYQSTSREITVGATAAQTEVGVEKNPITAWADQFEGRMGDMSSIAATTAARMQGVFADFFASGMANTKSLGEAFTEMFRRIAAEAAAALAVEGVIKLVGLAAGALFPAASTGAKGGTAIGLSAGGLVSLNNAIDGEVMRITGPGTGTSDSIAAALPVGSYIIREQAMRGLAAGGLVSLNNAIDGEVMRITGPGTGTSDSIPAALPVGSYILREQAMRGMGFADGGLVPARVSAGEGYVPPPVVESIGVAALDRINSLGAGLRTFASGGLVDGGAGLSVSDMADEVNVSVPVSIFGVPGGQDSTDAVAKASALKRELREAVDGRIVELQRPGGLLWGPR